MLPKAHQSPNPKRHLDRFSRFCTAHGRESLYFIQRPPLPLKFAISHGGSEPPSNTWFLKPTIVLNQVYSSASVNVFLSSARCTRMSSRMMDFFVPYPCHLFSRHDVGQTLRNGSDCDITFLVGQWYYGHFLNHLIQFYSNDARSLCHLTSHSI